MAVGTKIIRRRIKSITSTRKITKAMEMVAAAKMRRAVSATVASRPYARLSWDVVSRLSEAAPEGINPLLTTREVKKILGVVITSNRGLAGGFNANLIRAALGHLAKPEAMARPRVQKGRSVAKVAPDLTVEVVAVGKKGEAAFRRAGMTIVASFTELADTPTLAHVLPIAELAVQGYLSGSYDKIVVMYTDFVSALTQKPKIRQLLPISLTDLEKMITDESEESPNGTEYKFEPDARIILDAMLIRMVRVQLYQAFLESSASEHSARMLAMRNATDAAGEMIDDLTFTFNQARQAAITREISEISAGKAALE